jgi:hypothetical protein
MMFFTSLNKVIAGIVPKADIQTGSPLGQVVDVSNYHDIAGIFTRGAGATGTATVKLFASPNANGSGATAIEFRYRLQNADGTSMGDLALADANTGVLVTAGANKTLVFHVRQQVLQNIGKYFYLQLVTGTAGAVDGAVTYILSDAKFPVT